MGFAASLQSLTRLSLKVLPFAPPASLSFKACTQILSSDSHDTPEEPAPFIPSSYEPEGFKLTYTSIPVMRANRSRRRNTSTRFNNKAKANTASPQLSLALPAEAAPAATRQLKILQREPRKQPECMFISGRMADVCAALERMALNEQAQQA
ncbi:hypothetical protein [Comamonas sp. 26]|uniref:hypothetical protein n=1 Tax=Comamonas sp. 26 TaxID=2035201 RepID=UPI000C1870EC|nr:hypothetical protein [Comamonas sp. 26]PIG09309.1 hypothetical protein CLU84_2208 [Comamonas sp. 26]